jgi:hypothetical protein
VAPVLLLKAELERKTPEAPGVFFAEFAEVPVGALPVFRACGNGLPLRLCSAPQVSSPLTRSGDCRSRTSASPVPGVKQ